MTTLEKHGYVIGYLRKQAGMPAQAEQPVEMPKAPPMQPLDQNAIMASNDRMKNAKKKAALAEKALLQADAEVAVESVKQKSQQIDDKTQKEMDKADQAAQAAAEKQMMEQQQAQMQQQGPAVQPGPGSLGIPVQRQGAQAAAM